MSWQWIYHFWRVSLSASYTSQDIDRTLHTRLQPLYMRTRHSRFHLFKSRFCCLPANIAFFGLASARLRLFAVIIGQAYHIGVVATKMMIYTASMVILLYHHTPYRQCKSWWRRFLPQLAIGMVVLKLVTCLVWEPIPNAIIYVALPAPSAYISYSLCAPVCMYACMHACMYVCIPTQHNAAITATWVGVHTSILASGVPNLCWVQYWSGTKMVAVTYGLNICHRQLQISRYSKKSQWKLQAIPQTMIEAAKERILANYSPSKLENFHQTRVTFIAVPFTLFFLYPTHLLIP